MVLNGTTTVIRFCACVFINGDDGTKATIGHVSVRTIDW